jgi:hypothetical protein
VHRVRSRIKIKNGSLWKLRIGNFFFSSLRI